jgi:DNA-binding PadR family transcriptional regulator
MRTKEDQPARQLQILKLLAESDDPLNKYTMCRRLKDWSEPTILHDIDELEKKRIIRVIRTDTKATGWKPSKYYDLSPLGVMRLMSNVAHADRSWKHLADRVISKYAGQIPLIRRVAIQAYLKRLDGIIREARATLGRMVGPADVDAEFGDASDAREILRMLESFGDMVQRLLPAGRS